MGEGAVSAALGLAGVPAVSESAMIARDGALCLYEDARAHVQHLSARVSVEAVEAAKAAGAKLTAELTPHHLVLTDEEVRSLDARFKMNPPLRTEDDRQALIEALRSGVVDCIGTDHAPHAIDEKEVPFEQAMMGVTGLETAFAVLYTRARPARRDRPRPDRRADGRGRARSSTSSSPRIAATPRRTSPSSTSSTSGRPAPTAGRAAPTNSCFARAPAASRGP